MKSVVLTMPGRMPVVSTGGSIPFTKILSLILRLVELVKRVDRGAMVRSPATVNAAVPVPLVFTVMELCPPRTLTLLIVSDAGVLFCPL